MKFPKIDNNKDTLERFVDIVGSVGLLGVISVAVCPFKYVYYAMAITMVLMCVAALIYALLKRSVTLTVIYFIFLLVFSAAFYKIIF